MSSLRDEKFETRVVFKLTPMQFQEPIAFLLDGPTTTGIHILTYMHIGQHSEAYAGYYYDCTTATPDDYADLKEELEGMGYVLKVLKKCNAWDVARKNFREKWYEYLY